MTRTVGGAPYHRWPYPLPNERRAKLYTPRLTHRTTPNNTLTLYPPIPNHPYVSTPYP
jgi:hypothetical protein